MPCYFTNNIILFGVFGYYLHIRITTMRIKKGDNIIVISGKDKGKTGKVSKALPSENKIVVEGINVKKKHQRPKRANQKGQIISIASPLHVSNVMILDSKTGKGTRVGAKILEGKKVRVAKKSGTLL